MAITNDDHYITKCHVQKYCLKHGLEFWDKSRLMKLDPFEFSDTLCAGVYPQSISETPIMGIALDDGGNIHVIVSWDDNGGDEDRYVTEEDLIVSLLVGPPLHTAWAK